MIQPGVVCTISIRTRPIAACANRVQKVETSGTALAGTLEKYSERGIKYVTLLRTVIAQNRLAQLNKARLRD